MPPASSVSPGSTLKLRPLGCTETEHGDALAFILWLSLSYVSRSHAPST